MNNRSLQVILGTIIISVILPLQFLHAKDVLIMKGNKSYEGAFQGYKNDKFSFLPDGGKTVNALRSFAEKLVIDPPALVTVTPKGKKKIEDMRLKSYEKSTFLFDKDGTDVPMTGMQISAIEMGLDFARAAGGSSGMKADFGNDASGSVALNIDLKELSAWMKEGNPAPSQVKAFDRYKAAKTAYDSFLETSAAMVKAMDKATGAAREDHLNKLRKRKNDEQPLIGELKAAEKELLAAFPDIKVPAAEK